MKFASLAVFPSLLVTATLSGQAVAPQKLNSSADRNRSHPVNFAVLTNTISKFFGTGDGSASPVPFESLTSSFLATGAGSSKGGRIAVAAVNATSIDARDEITAFLPRSTQASNSSEAVAVDSQEATATMPRVAAVMATTEAVPTKNAAAAMGLKVVSTTWEASVSSTVTSTSTPAKTISSASLAMHKGAATMKLATTTTTTGTIGSEVDAAATVLDTSAVVSHVKARVQVAPLSAFTVPARTIAANKSAKPVSGSTSTTKLAEKDVDALPMAGFAEAEPTTTATSTSIPVSAAALAVHKVMANVSEAVIAHPGLNQSVSMADEVASLDTAQQSEAKAKIDAKDQEMKQLRKEITAELRSEFQAQLKFKIHQALEDEHRKEDEEKTTAMTTTTSTTATANALTTQSSTTTTTISTHKMRTTTAHTHETAHQKSWHQHDRKRRQRFKVESETTQSIAHKSVAAEHRFKPEPALTQFERLQKTQAAAHTAAMASERSLDSWAEADGALFNDRLFQDVDVPSMASESSGAASITTTSPVITTTATTEAGVAGLLAPIIARAHHLLARLLGEVAVSKPLPRPATTAALLQKPAFERLMQQQNAARTAGKVVEERMEDIASYEEWSGHEREDVDSLQELASVDRSERARAATKEKPHFLSPAEIDARRAESVPMSETWVQLEQEDNYIKKVISNGADNADLNVLGSVDGIQDRAMRQLNEQQAEADRIAEVPHMHVSKGDPERKQLHEPFTHLQKQDEAFEHRIETNPDLGA